MFLFYIMYVGEDISVYSSLTKKDMSGELHNMDKSVQIETVYNKCGIVELHGFEVLTE